MVALLSESVVANAVGTAGEPILPISAGEDAGSGETLDDHLARGSTALSTLKWDYVVLQEHSGRPLEDKPKMLAAVKELAARVHARGATTLLFETWAHAGHLSDQPRLQAIYREAGTSISAAVVPAGDAFAIALKRAPSINLYDDDRHPSVRGTYLAACVFIAVLYKTSPVGLDGPTGVEMDLKERTMLQESAWAAVNGLIH
jgi:hypothetical protein